MTLIFLLILCIISYCHAESWTVYVYTGNERFAGTDSNVYIRLLNSKNESTSEYQLTHYNWIPNNNDFPLRNLFEKGARERFRIRTEDIGSIAKIQIRQNNFPKIQADWLLDQIIIERNRDGAKYTFRCNCWLRRDRLSITIPAVPDRRTIDTNETNNSSSKTKRALVIILVILITLLVCMFCCFNEYRRRRRRQRHRSFSLNDTIEQIQQEPALLDRYYPGSSRSSSPSGAPQIWTNTKRQWKNFRTGLSSYIHTQTTQSATTVPTTTITPADEPPAYEDLYPNTTVPISTASSSNL